MARDITRSHHEYFDGTGYPEQLHGDEIPIEARIFAIADVFDALTTKRPYKKKVSTAEAYKLIIESSGVLFDPDIVEVFKSNWEEILTINKSIK